MSNYQLIEVIEGLTEDGRLVYRCRGRSAPDLSRLAIELGVPVDRLSPQPDPELYYKRVQGAPADSR